MLKSSSPRLVLSVLAVMSTFVMLTGCTSADAAAPQEPTKTTVTNSPQPSDAPSATESPEESFRAWLTASRAPDSAVACGYLSDALIEKMIAEMNANGWTVSDCTEMTTMTAELYAAFDQSSEVVIETRSETTDSAELFVTYVEGDCGRVDLARKAARWIMTELTEEVC